MAETHTLHWKSLERWSPTLFLAAGVLFVGHATVRGIEAFTLMPPPVDVFGPTGYVAAISGLFGMYPALAGRVPRIGRIATITAAITVPAWVLIAGWSFGEAAGVVPQQTNILPGIFFAVVVVATLLTYLLFGVASLRAGVHRRAFSVLLMTPVVFLSLLIVAGVLLSMRSVAGGVVIGGGLAIIHGAIGGTLMTGSTQPARMDASTDMPVE